MTREARPFLALVPRWGRPDDEAGAAFVASGLSGAHRRYLASGQVGFLIGDGALRYGPEVLGEVYYRAALTREVSLGVNYQPIFNPAFNRDRGPALSSLTAPPCIFASKTGAMNLVEPSSSCRERAAARCTGRQGPSHRHHAARAVVKGGSRG